MIALLRHNHQALKVWSAHRKQSYLLKLRNFLNLTLTKFYIFSLQLLQKEDGRNHRKYLKHTIYFTET